MSSNTKSFKRELIQRYWDYQEKVFPGADVYFEQGFSEDRPPVFQKARASDNILIDPQAPISERRQLIDLIPSNKRHRWFRSMNSSQALAQSVFGNLWVYGELDSMSDLMDNDGKPFFWGQSFFPEDFQMEYEIDYFGEPRRTSIDVLLDGKYRIAIECKFTEEDFGCCSRPALKPSDSTYEEEYCNGSYDQQRGREHSCSLTEIGVKYWKFIPELFRWRNDEEYFPCPIKDKYQLVRNILAACVKPDGSVSENNGHVVVVYDERNPSFQEGGKAFLSFKKTVETLKNPSLLRKCSWQDVVSHLRNKGKLNWLTEELNFKYGF